MDIDEPTDQIESIRVEATINDEEMASSSSGRINPITKERSDNETDSTALGEVVKTFSESDGAAVCSETIRSQSIEETTSSLRESLNRSQELIPEGHGTQSGNIDEEHQNEQHIENAGIDPNYPLVLVQRVSLPSPGDESTEQVAENNNEDPIAMNQDIGDIGAEEVIPVEGRSLADAVAAFNAIPAVGSDTEDEEEEVEAVDDDEDTWSDDFEDDAAFLENPNFRGFTTEFEALRNMIAETRRSMVEVEANSEPIRRSSLMQRFRRILFVLSRRRRQLERLGLSLPDAELQMEEADSALDAALQGTNPSNNDTENAENPPNEEPNNITMEHEEEMNENAVRFDTDLPAEHSYMGDNMNRVSGVNYLEADQYIKLRLFVHQHILFPGEVLPFMVDSSTNIIEGDIDAQNGILFGVCFPCLSKKRTSNEDANSSLSDSTDQLLYGVTCQIYELGQDNRSNTLIKSRALQRFVTKANDLLVPLEYINAHPRTKCFGYVKILPDVYLPDPLNCINMGSAHRFRDNPSMKDMYKRFQAATTPWPAHVYETHNISNIIEKARTQLAQHKIDTMPSDPTQLSYWLVRNLHLPEDMLKSVFLANTVNTRLKLLAGTFKKDAIFSCRNCAAHIADCRELFAMSKHGVQSQYCNSAGFVHETNTLYQVNRQNIIYSGAPSTEFSWFPGYQWHIIVCKLCKQHLGWEFKAIVPNLIPKQFFGISSSSVDVRLSMYRDVLPAQNAVYINFLRLMNAGMSGLRGNRNNMPHI